MAQDTKDNNTTTNEVTNTKSVTIKQDIPQEFESNLDLVKDAAERISRDGEFGFNNRFGNVTLKRDGQINISSGIDSQIKASSNGTIESISLNNFVKANIMKIEMDDMIINNHKFNNKIIELADFKNVLNTETAIEKNKVVGGITMLGTVLTKTWDKYLKRYVLIRRLVNIPVFSPSMGATDAHPGLQITPSTERIKEMQAAYKNSGLDMESYLKSIDNTNSSLVNVSGDKSNTENSQNQKEAKSMTEVLTKQKAGTKFNG